MRAVEIVEALPLLVAPPPQPQGNHILDVRRTGASPVWGVVTASIGRVSEEQVFEDDEQPDAQRERAYDVGRLMAISDGVFAVAITLLVFNVPVPTIAQNDATSRLPAALLETGPRLLTFALSFFLVGFYWIQHHQLFRQLVSVNVRLLWLNLVVLFLVCLLPFSSGVVGRYPDTVVGAEVYAVNLAAIALAFLVLYLFAARSQQMRSLPPGMDAGFFGQGFLLPLVVVAMVMVLAPFNLVVAYSIGVTLMALVGVYTAAVPRTVGSAPLRGTASGHLRLSGGLAHVRVRSDAAMPELFRARFTGPQPKIRVAGNAVDIVYRGVRPLIWRRQSAQIGLNTSIPWQIEVSGGLFRSTLDLTGLQVTAVTVDGGASRVEMRLPRPSGTVPIRFRGGASIITVRRPNGVAVRAVVRGGASKVQLDGRRLEWTDETPLQLSDDAGAADRYELEFTVGANRLIILKEPN